MKKSAQVVMLPTNEKANIWLDNFGTGLYNCPTGATGVIYQHLYILSDEKIKEGDWVYDVCDGIVKVEHEYQLSYIMVFKIDCKKIIATTDRSLEVVSKGINPVYEKLPQPSTSFLEKFVEEYNKGNVITEVLVEYNEPITEIPKPYKPYSEVEHLDSTLKVSKDNTININMPKDSWSREEMLNLLESAWNGGALYGSSKPNSHYFDKWIEENL